MGNRLRSVTDPVLGSTEASVNFSVPFRVGGAVVEDQPYLGLARRPLRAPAGERPVQAQHLGARLGDIDIDRIELLDGGQRGGLSAVTRAPVVTAERPMRPEIGAVTLV